MALKKEKTLPNGDIVRYHKIGTLQTKEVVIHEQENPIEDDSTSTSVMMYVILESYRSSEERYMNASPITFYKYPFIHIIDGDKSMFQEAYETIKKLPEWEDATDDFPVIKEFLNTEEQTEKTKKLIKIIKNSDGSVTNYYK